MAILKAFASLRQKVTVKHPSIRLIGTQVGRQRIELLHSIYDPSFAHLKPGSTEYEALADSGRVWEEYFKPRDLAPWLAAQSKLESTLKSVDKFKPFFDDRPELRNSTARALVCEYAHQSTSIEANPLFPSEALAIAEELERRLFSHLDDFGAMSAQALSNLDLPSTDDLLPTRPAAQVAEVRNHIVVSRYATDVALSKPGTPGMSLDDIKFLTRTMLSGTDAELIAKHAWGPRVPLGEFRSAPIGVRSNPLRVFPYHREVPACMDRLFAWRDEMHAAGQLHPLILATKLCVYLAHVHPFADGNGRASRVLMADYLVRQGYLPVVFLDLVDRLDYIKMIFDAEDGEPDELCAVVAQTCLDMMLTISSR